MDQMYNHIALFQTSVKNPTQYILNESKLSSITADMEYNNYVPIKQFLHLPSRFAFSKLSNVLPSYMLSNFAIGT